MNLKVFSVITLMIICFSSSAQDLLRENELKEEKEILILLEKQKKYHLDKMEEEVVSQLSENYIEINHGEIKAPSKEENIISFRQYFNSVEFEKWDDISPPIIRFSDDYSMAYAIISKEVVFVYLNDNEEAIRASTIYSWVAIYTKWESEWKIDCIASTNEPVIVNKVEND